MSGLLNGATIRVRSKYLAIRFFTNEIVTTNGWNISVAKVVDGSWSEWHGPSLCSGSCFPFSQGTQTSFRYCNNPSPSNGGADCTGVNTTTVSCTPVCKSLTINSTPGQIVFDYQQDYLGGLYSQWLIMANHSSIAGYVLTAQPGGVLVTILCNVLINI